MAFNLVVGPDQDDNGTVKPRLARSIPGTKQAWFTPSSGSAGVPDWGEGSREIPGVPTRGSCCMVPNTRVFPRAGAGVFLPPVIYIAAGRQNVFSRPGDARVALWRQPDLWRGNGVGLCPLGPFSTPVGARNAVLIFPGRAASVVTGGSTRSVSNGRGRSFFSLLLVGLCVLRLHHHVPNLTVSATLAVGVFCLTTDRGQKLVSRTVCLRPDNFHPRPRDRHTASGSP